MTARVSDRFLCGVCHQSFASWSIKLEHFCNPSTPPQPPVAHGGILGKKVNAASKPSTISLAQ